MTPLAPRQALLRGVGLLFFYLAIPALLMLFPMMALSQNSVSQLPDTISSMVSTAGYLVAIVLICRYLRRKEIPLECFFGHFRQPLGRWLGLYLLLAGLGLGAMVSAGLTLLPLSPDVRASYDSASLYAFGEGSRLLAVLLTVLFAPLGEELFFRAILVRTFARGMSPWLALGLSSLLFGLLHLHPVWVAYASLMGLLFGWLALRCDNVVVPILVHMGFNLSSLPGLLFYDRPWYRELPTQPWVLVALMLAGGLAAWRLLKVAVPSIAPSGPIKEETERTT